MPPPGAEHYQLRTPITRGIAHRFHRDDGAGHGKIMMGTDYPVFLGEPDPVGFVKKTKGLSKQAKEAIIGKNAARLLRIPV